MDIAAVANAVELPYSNGFIEGNNNRLKMIKRIMYGRAKMQLLAIRVLYGEQFFLADYTHI
jgi:transposase